MHPHNIMRMTKVSRGQSTQMQEQGAHTVIPALPRTNEV